MGDIEIRAHNLVRLKNWESAVVLFDQLLAHAFNASVPKERIVSYLLDRSECCFELGRHEDVVLDCRQVIRLLGHNFAHENGVTACQRMIHALVALQRYEEAEAARKELVDSTSTSTEEDSHISMKVFESVISGIHTNRSPNDTECLKVSMLPVPEDERFCLADTRLDSWTAMGLGSDLARNKRYHSATLEICGEDAELSEERLCKLPSHDTLDNADPCNQSSLKEDAFLHDLKQVTDATSNLQLRTNGMHDSTSRMLMSSNNNKFPCTYCSMSFPNRAELRAHCQTEAHQTVIMSDEGRDWKFRPPPRGLTSDAYLLCENWSVEGGSCRYGAQCVDAHGSEELAEWRERFEYRRMKLQRACEKELFGKSYTEQLLERWIQAPNPEKVMREKLPDIEEMCSDDLTTTVSSKMSEKEWKFTLRTHRALRAVALLQDAYRNHFCIKTIRSNSSVENALLEWDLNNDQEWNAPNACQLTDCESPDRVGGFGSWEHCVEVLFVTDIYGTFRQSVVFDFGSEPVLVKHICVDVVPVTDMDKLKEVRKELVLTSSERWDSSNAHIVKYASSLPPLGPVSASSIIDEEREKNLLNGYPNPRADSFALTQSTVVEKKLTQNNYRARMHELLCLEEMARYEQVARYNLTATLQLVDCYLLAPSSSANSTAKYAHAGELFAVLNLGKDVSEDTSAGRLILNNCTTVLLAGAKSTPLKPEMAEGENGHRHETEVKDSDSEMRIVYEALIEDKGKTVIYLRLSSQCVEYFHLRSEMEFVAEVQFQLNRIPYCEWHYAIDKIADFSFIFPDTFLEPSIPWTPQRQWSEILDPKLNLKQKEAVVAITTPVNYPLPPILIIGPFGTGKTYTLAQAIKQLLLQPDTRILVCTHSNSAADLYIKDYLHPYVEAGNEYARPLRIYYHKRWVATVHSTVQKYCLINVLGGMKCFRVPTLEDIRKHRVIVVTLSISMYLSTLGLSKGYFTHILLDEAAQAMECEAIMPLALANEKTRIVLAGDHMQLSPELFSLFAKERNLHVSLLERLYDHYPATFPCKILLCENYRAHEAIIQFTSELFYDQKLISSGKQPRHEKFYPLTFFTTRGEDVQDMNSTAFYNNSEVYEVVERVSELRKQWPAAWGKMDDQSIGIMTPYSDQVFRIRSELRKKRLGGISVERVLNVQGKQFRAIFLSTVRTRRTCNPGSKSSVGVEDMDYGFLSNSKLLNTAITRAQSLVAVVGDPVALCSIGRCRKVWERFIEICNENKSLFGITWSNLRSQLDGVELKKTFVLNPLAPEFVPRQYQGESYIRLPSLLGPYGSGSMLPPFGAALRFPQVSQQCLPPGYCPYPQPPTPFFYSGPPPAPPPQAVQPLTPANPALYPPRGPVPAGIMGPAPLIYPPLNTWGYPLISPTPGVRPAAPTVPWTQSPPGDFLRKQQQQQPPFPHVPAIGPVPSLNENQQPKFPVPVRTNSVPKVNGNMSSHSVTAMLSPSVPAQDSYVPGGVLSPTMMSANEALPSTSAVNDKSENIQFLQNVHFPEKHVKTQEKKNKAPGTSTILPPEVPLEQILNSRDQQMEWYRHLFETSGKETANNFLELILANTPQGVNTAPPVPPNQDCFHPHVVRGLEELFSDRGTGGVASRSSSPIQTSMANGPSLLQQPQQLTPLTQNPLAQNLQSQNPLSQNLLSQNLLSRNPLPQNLLPQNLLSQNTLSQLHLSQNYQSQNSVPQNHLSQNPMTRNLTQNYLSQTSISQSILSQNHLSQASISQTLLSQNHLSQNQLSQSQLPQNHLSQNHLSQNQLSQSQLPQNHLSQNQLSQNQLSQSQLPQNHLSQNHLSQSQLSQSQLPQNHLSQNHLSPNHPSQNHQSQNHQSQNHLSQIHPSQNHLSQNHLSQNHLSQNYLSQNHLSQNHLSQNHLSQNHLSQNQLPQNQLPQNQLPQNQLPQNQLPQNQLPQNQLPQNQLPQNHLSQTSMSQNLLSQNHLSQNHLLHNSLPQIHLPQHPLSQYPLPQNPVSQNSLAQSLLQQNPIQHLQQQSSQLQQMHLQQMQQRQLPLTQVSTPGGALRPGNWPVSNERGGKDNLLLLREGAGIAAAAAHTLDSTVSGNIHASQLNISMQEGVPQGRSWPPHSAEDGNDEQIDAQEALIPHHLLEALSEKTAGGGSGAFAGYARAAVSIGFQQQREPTAPSGAPYQQHSFPVDDDGDYVSNPLEVNNLLLQQEQEYHGIREPLVDGNIINQHRSESMTYASVLRSPRIGTLPLGEDEEENTGNDEPRDPYALLSGLAGASGLYHYFP